MYLGSFSKENTKKCSYLKCFLIVWKSHNFSLDSLASEWHKYVQQKYKILLMLRTVWHLLVDVLSKLELSFKFLLPWCWILRRHRQDPNPETHQYKTPKEWLLIDRPTLSTYQKYKKTLIDYYWWWLLYQY